MDKPFEFICPRCQTSLGFLTDDRIIRVCPECQLIVHPGPRDSTVVARETVMRLQNQLDELTRNYNREIKPYLVCIAASRAGEPKYFEPDGPASTAYLAFLTLFLQGLVVFLACYRILIFAIPLAIFAVWFAFKAPIFANEKWENYQRLTQAYKAEKKRLLREMAKEAEVNS